MTLLPSIDHVPPLGREPGGWRDALLDATVLRSFDRHGFRRHAAAFVDTPDVDLARALTVVTGATSGIGQATARALSARGARSVVWGRTASKVEGVVSALPGAGDGVVADLGDPEAVVAGVEALPDGPVAVLVCNAGALPGERRLTPWGHEEVWASQVLGHVLLVRALLAAGRLVEGSRVIWVSSGGMYLNPLSLDDLDWSRRRYDGVTAYANAKRAQVVLGERLHASVGPRGIRVATMHPGWASTPGVTNGLPTFDRLMGSTLRDAAQGADTVVWLASTAAPWPGGRFWFDRAPVPTQPVPGTATSEALRDALWTHVLAETGPHLRRFGVDGLAQAPEQPR